MKKYLKKVVLFTYWNVNFHLSPTARNVNEETWLCHSRTISSGDATNEAVAEERETMRCQNKKAPVYFTKCWKHISLNTAWCSRHFYLSLYLEESYMLLLLLRYKQNKFFISHSRMKWVSWAWIQAESIKEREKMEDFILYS